MERLFIHIFNMSISASWLILAVLAVRLLLRRAPKNMRCFLWLLVGIRLLIPISIESVFSLVPDTRVAEESMALQQQELISDTAAVGQLTVAASHMDAPEAAVTGVNKAPDAGTVCAGVWLAGMVLMLGYMMVSWMRIRRRVRTAIPMDFAIDEEHQTRVYQSDAIAGPFLFGIIAPRIYIPMQTAAEELPYVILHEKAHMKRRDYLIKPTGFLLLSVYWFNPLIWIAYILLCRDIELVCDEMVIRKLGEQCKRAYSQALLNGAVNRRMITACPVAFGEAGVKARVKNVLNYKKPAFWILVAAILACIIVPVCFMTQKKEESEAPFTDDAELVQSDGAAEKAEEADIAQTEELLKRAEALSEALEQQWVHAEAVTGQEFYVKQTEVEALIAQLQAEQETLQRLLAAKQAEMEKAEMLETELQADALQAQKEPEAAREAQLQALESELQAAIEALEKNQAMLEELLKSEGQTSDARGYIEQWAQAFCNRDANTIIRLAGEEAEEELTDKDLLVHGFTDGKDYAGFGWSSPWPWGAAYEEDASASNYRIVNVTDRSAEILYYAWVSNPHVTVWRELLTFSMENDRFVITSETLETMDGICTAEQFYQAYPGGVLRGTMMDYYEYNGAGEALNDNAKEGLETKELFHADTAALYLLNLSGSTRTNFSGDKIDGKSICTVQVMFGDQSSVEVTMIQPYGEDGIWVPWSNETSQDMLSTGSYIINRQNIDGIRREDAVRLEALFPDHHEYSTVSGYADLNGDGFMERVEMTDLHYNGGDGGYALTVTDGKTGKEIPLPSGYTQERGFPLQAIYVQPRQELAILMGEEDPKCVLVSISAEALWDIYERKGMYQEIKRSLTESGRELSVDALSGCNIVTSIGEEKPVLVLKSYVSGFMGHADTLGYVITELRLQEDNTWEEKSYFLLDSCAEEITQKTAAGKEEEAVAGQLFQNLPFRSDTDINVVQLQPQ